MPNISINPIAVWSKQARFIADTTTPVMGFVGGRGSSKTRSAAIKIMEDARNDWPILAVSKNYKTLVKTTLPTFLEVAAQYNAHISDKLSPVPEVRFRTKDGGTASVTFVSGVDPDNLRGPNMRMLWIDEASYLKNEVMSVGRAVLRWRRQKGQVLLTFTPRGRRHWTFTEFYTKIDKEDVEEWMEKGREVHLIEGKPYLRKERTTLIQARSDENPFLPDDFVRDTAASSTAQFNRQELGGEFVDFAGLIFMRSNFEEVDSHPESSAIRIRYWDKAATHGSGCYTSGCRMAYNFEDEMWYIEDIVRGQWGYKERDEIIQKTAESDAKKFGNEVIIYMEQEGGSAGKEVMQQAIKRLAGYPVYSDVVSGKRTASKDNIVIPGEAKITRAMGLAAQVEAGNVAVCSGAWKEDFLEEICAFPESEYFDQVDSASGAFNMICKRITSGLSPSQVEKDMKNRLGEKTMEALRSRLRRLGKG